MSRILSFFTGASWTTYILIGLVVALLALAFLYKKEVEHTGSLEAEKAALTSSLEASERDKQHLSDTIAINAQSSLEDTVERESLRSQVVKLNKEVSSLKTLTKTKVKNNESPISNIQADDDIELSDSLRSLLEQSACSSNPNLCRNSSEPAKPSL